jgi:hypothetical protein
MKYKLIFWALVSLMWREAVAQYKPKKFEIGPKIGLNVSGIGSVDTISFKKKIGANYQVGIFTRINAGKLSIQPEFIYNQKGGTLTSPVSQKLLYRYLSTPILVGLSPLKGIYFEGGAELSWPLNRNYKPAGRTIYGPTAASDKAWVAGVRVNMLDALSLFSINLRYTHGMTNQSNQKIGSTPVDFRNRSLQLSATYAFSEYWLWKRKYGVKKRK